MYDGEVIAKAEEMGKPGLVTIKQKQVGAREARCVAGAPSRGGAGAAAWPETAGSAAGPLRGEPRPAALGPASC